MKGILGRKLGMTQIFDPETGGVTAVTVIEAGPCPVTHVRSEAADGYTAVQLAYEPVVDRKITKGELGHLKKAGTTAHRHLAEFRGDTELDRRRHGHRRGVRARRRDQGRGHVGRQGLRRHDQAAQLQARPRQPRLAQRARARLDRRLGDSVPRVPGTEDVGPHGRRRASPSSGSSSTRWMSSATCCSSRAPFRARRAASSRSGAPTDGCVEGRVSSAARPPRAPRSRQPCSAPS